LRIALIPLLLLIVIAAFSLDTQVIPESDLLKRFPMTTVFYQGSALTRPVRTADFTVNGAQDGSFLARGRDKSGKRWRAVLSPATRGLWESNLNGRRTYFFAGYTGGAGMAPGTWLLILSFDEQGRPVPFYVVGRASYDSKGIGDILDLDGAGPELLQQDWLETNWMPDARSGYYITTLYRQQGRYWYRADGRHGERSFPLYEKWAILPDTRPQLVTGPAIPQGLLADYGNDPQAGVHARVQSPDGRRLEVGSPLGCKLDSVAMVVQDTRDGREMTTNPSILPADFQATFTGLHRWPNSDLCSASIMWATTQ
jgi:hypothetical protein